MIINSASPKTTQNIAKLLAEEVLKNGPRNGNALVFALSGELGAGKTTFIQGFARGLGIRRRLTSPTFLIFRNYPIKGSRYGKLFHVDAYRLKEAKELDALGLGKAIKDPRNILLIEWADKIKEIIPKNSVWIKIRHHKEGERTIEMGPER